MPRLFLVLVAIVAAGAMFWAGWARHENIWLNLLMSLALFGFVFIPWDPNK